MVVKLKKNVDTKALKLALVTSTPVFFGYLAIGIAFGLLLEKTGYPWFVALLMSVLIYAGAMQFMAIGLFVSNAAFFEIAIVTLLVNFRHMIYGLSLFDKFNLMGWLKPYMIFALTDETYALLTTIKEPAEINKRQYYFFIALFDQLYWVLGSVIGAAAGTVLTFNTQGLDFALTALFIVLMLEQFKAYKSKIPFMIGGVCAAVSILTVGKANMLLLAVFSSIICLLLLKERIKKNESV